MILRVILLDSPQQRWLATHSGELPSITVDSGRDRTLDASLSALLQCPLRRLFCPYRSKEEAILVVERLEERREPSLYHWTDDDTALSLTEREALAQARTPHPLRVPWAYPGWLDGALAWLRDAVGEPLTQVEQVKSWSLSCVFRAQTRVGWVYFKATAPQPLFCNEPLVTQRLAELFPTRVPRPIAIEPQRLWMALSAFEGILQDQPERGGSADAMAALGELQKSFLGQPERLKALGAVDRRLSHLAQAVPHLLADRRCAPELTDEQWEQILAQDWLAQISRWSDVPDTLIHGDPHIGNVAVTPTGLQIFDWSDASIGPPFLDLLDPLFDQDPGTGTRLQAAQASTLGITVPWPECAPLIGLHHAVSYYHIVKNSEPCVRHEQANSIAHLLIKSLDFLQYAEKHT